MAEENDARHLISARKQKELITIASARRSTLHAKRRDPLTLSEMRNCRRQYLAPPGCPKAQAQLSAKPIARFPEYLVAKLCVALAIWEHHPPQMASRS